MRKFTKKEEKRVKEVLKEYFTLQQFIASKSDRAIRAFENWKALKKELWPEIEHAERKRVIDQVAKRAGFRKSSFSGQRFSSS